MAYRVEFTPKAEEEYKNLPSNIQKRIDRWLGLLAEDPRQARTKQLKSRPELRRVHAGPDYVIVYTIRTKILVLVVKVAHRKDVYRRR